MNDTPEKVGPLDPVADALATGDMDDPNFHVLCAHLFRYLVGPAPARHVAIFMHLATEFREKLRAKDLAYKAERYLAANPNPTQGDLAVLSKLSSEALIPFLEGLDHDSREKVAKVLEFRGPRPAPEPEAG